MDILTWLFMTSLNKSLKTLPLLLAVLVIRLLLPRGQKRLRVWLWGIAALSLMLPVLRIENPFSLVPSAIPVPEKIVYATEPAIESGIPAVNEVVNSSLQIAAYDDAASCSPMYIAMVIAGWVWLAGIAAMLLYTVFSTVRLHLQLRGAKKDAAERRVYRSSTVQTPFILGTLFPHIYLPEQLSEADCRAVLLHERAHIRRGDHIWKMLGFLLLSIYWYHPLLWLCYALLTRDIEFACDERVIRKMDAPEKKAYSEALLHCSLLHLPRAACPLAFGEVAVRARIASVAQFRKTGAAKTALACVTVPVLAFCFLTDPVGQRYVPEHAVFQRWILDETPVQSSSYYRYCDYVLMESDFEPFYDQRKISYHYAAVLVQEYTMQDGALTLTGETFSPVFIWFKGDRLCGYYDLEKIMNQPRSEFEQSRAVGMMQAHFPQVDLNDESWRSYYGQLAESCAAQAAGR